MFIFLQLRVIVIFIFFFIIEINTGSYLKAQGRYGTELPPGSITTLTSVEGYLYSGIDNYLRLNKNSFQQCDTFILAASNSLIVNDTSDQYLIIPEKIGDIRLVVYCIKAIDTLTIGYNFFTVRNLPEPYITFNDIQISTSSSISKNSLLAADSIGIHFSDDIIGSENWLMITDFTIGYNYGGFYFSHVNNTNKISQKTKELINRLGPDHEIIIRINIESEGKIKKELPIYRIKLY